MSDIHATFFSTFNLDRLRCLAEAVRKYSVQLEVIDPPSRNPLKVMAALLKRPRTDILLTHDWLMFPVFMAFLNILRGTPYILISNSLVINARRLNHWSRWRIEVYKKMFKFALERSNAIVCNSSFLKSELDSLFPRFRQKTIVIHNGIDVPSQPLKDVFDYPEGFNFLTLTNFEFPYKFAGIDLILKALELTPIDGANLFVLGKALSKQGYENLEQFRARVSKEYNSINIYVIPNANVFSFFQPESALFLYSSGEGGDSLPRAILEAQAMGMPSIIVNTNGCAEAVIPGRSAIVVEPDVKALAVGIQHILSPECDQRLMGLLASQNIRDKFTWEYMAEQYTNLFCSLKTMGDK